MKKLLYMMFLSLITMACSNTSNRYKQEVCATPEFLPNQSEGNNILQKLTQRYGNDVMGNPLSPSFIEGTYFDMDNYIVFQVRGDSITIRDSLEKLTGSKMFHLEMIKGKRYSQKELRKILDEMRARIDTVTDEALKENVIMTGVEAHNIFVMFILDTPEMRKAFREKISDSPAIKFGCSVEPNENNSVYTNDTLGISLVPEFSVYADTATRIPIILLNNSTDIISCGESYEVTYQDQKGTWRTLPINTFALSIEYIVFKNKYRRLYASIYPKINNNKPGKYRFFTDINLTPRLRQVTTLKMMTEFTLTNDYEAVKKAKRLRLPEQKP